MRCDECKSWESRGGTYGVCSALPGDKVDIELEFGNCSCYVDEIETAADFFYGYFEAKGKEVRIDGN